MIPSALQAAGPLAAGLFDLVDQLFTSEDERQAAKLKLLELENSGKLAQIAVNTQEAKHSSLFVAGWRPFIGWVCGFAFAWAFLLYPVLQFAVVALGLPVNVQDLPLTDLGTMMPVLLGMLGLGGLRTYERRQGVARNNMKSNPNPRVNRHAKAGA